VGGAGGGGGARMGGVGVDGAAEGGEDAGDFEEVWGVSVALVEGEMGGGLLCRPILPYPAMPTLLPTQSVGSGKS
jgi:hypothetical protein